MKPYVLALGALCCHQSVQAYSNFISNPDSLYPPGCATNPFLGNSDYKKLFYEGNLALIDYTDPAKQLDAKVEAFRIQCADPNRSIILLDFSDPLFRSDPPALFQVPRVRAQVEGAEDYRMSLVREPHSWKVDFEHWGSLQAFGGIYNDGWWGPFSEDWTFVLEEGDPPPGEPAADESFSASSYNGNFKLVLTGADGAELAIDVPSTAALFDSEPQPVMPLSGRLSGNWVVNGAPDQGFLISVSELVEEEYINDPYHNTIFLMFISWYTYDANGDLLWLTGAARFDQGTTQLTVPIELVTNGQFLGTKPADREVVGSVTLTGSNCNDLGFEYELNGIGLGSGTKRLQRPFSLEIAGHVCRDGEARTAANTE